MSKKVAAALAVAALIAGTTACTAEETPAPEVEVVAPERTEDAAAEPEQIGRASCRERVF